MGIKAAIADEDQEYAKEEWNIGMGKTEEEEAQKENEQ
jgi:hypothetical protein